MSSVARPVYNAKDYSRYRPEYPESLYAQLRKYIGLRDNEKVEIAVDMGCGTGQVTLALGKRLANKIFGVDTSEAMIKQARENAGAGSAVNFVVGNDGTLTSQFKKHSVDLVTAATAAHYFSYPDFWETAHYILKPGGTLALWTYFISNILGYPEALKAIEDFAFNPEKCGAYWSPGVDLVYNMYKDLVPPSHLYENEERVVNDYYELRPEQPFELYRENVPVSDIVGLMGTYSGYISWKKDNPDKEDILEQAKNRIISSTGLTMDSTVTIKWSSVYVFAKTKAVSE